MKNNNTRTAIAFYAIAMLLIGTLFVFCGCQGQKEENIPGDYTIQVKTSGGMILEDAMISVYADESMQDLVWKGEADREGTVSFRAPSSDGCVAVVEPASNGFVCDEFYPIVAGENVITVETVIREDVRLNEINYSLGDVVCDFTVIAYDGTEYKISELLEEKKAVVLNFWFMNCGPCRMEFPYLQQAYEEYSDTVEVLALNPLDGTDERISEYAEQLGLTFPMSACSPEWESSMKLTAYPTTVVIDRYGTVSMIHTGSITEKETFTAIFDYFTDDDYVQTTVRNLSDINK